MTEKYDQLSDDAPQDDSDFDSEFPDIDGEDVEDFDPDYTPRIAILGAGPVGLEAALYGRYLGYQVVVLEKESVAHNVVSWGHVRMFSPFAMNRTALGVAALQAQHDQFAWPEDNALLMGHEFAEQYLLPLSQSDLLSDCIHEHVEVLSVARDGIIKSDQSIDRADYQFRILVRTVDGEDIVEADFVIDTTGVFQTPNYCGHGGLPAIGERTLKRANVFHQVPDVLGSQRAEFEGKRVLLVGNGYSAASSVVALSELQRQSVDTRVTWVTRREASEEGPMPIALHDVLPERQRLCQLANEATKAATNNQQAEPEPTVPEGTLQFFDQSAILAIHDAEDGSLELQLGGKAAGEYTFDVVVSNTGYRPNLALFRELQVNTCRATEATGGMGEWLQQQGRIDALDQELPNSQVLETGEPNYFVLGSKSYGRNSNFLLSLGHAQIQAVFSIIADREDLDLYGTMANLV